jgi:hypothetical protein
MSKGSLETPFTHAPAAASTSDGGGSRGRHPVDSVAQKADVGPGDLSLKFAEDLMPSKAALDTPFQDQLTGGGIINPKKSGAGTGGGSVSKGSLDTPFTNANKSE